MEYNQQTLLNNIDRPWQFAGRTVDELLSAAIPCAMGFLMNPIIAIISGAVSGYCYTFKIKPYYPVGVFTSFYYKNLPDIAGKFRTKGSIKRYTH